MALCLHRAELRLPLSFLRSAPDVFSADDQRKPVAEIVGRQDVMLSALGRSERFKLGLSVLQRNFPFKQYLSNTKRDEKDYSSSTYLPLEQENFHWSVGIKTM
jgi:hypothetical protein